MRITGEGHSGRGDDHQVTITGSKAHINKLKQAMLGLLWFACGGGKPVTRPRLKSDIDPPAGPDPTLFDHWPIGSGLRYIRGLNPEKKNREAYSPSIHVQHITGYGGGRTYEEIAADYTAAGFVCMRSQCGEAGEYWEVWFLPGAWKARGPIEGKKIEDILTWVRRQGPGEITLDGQHWGLSID